MRRLAWTLAATAVMAGCGGPTVTLVPTPTPTPTSTITPTAGPSQTLAAQFHVFVSGTIAKETCELSPSLGGCPAIMVIVPGLDWRAPPNWMPSLDDAVITTTEQPEGWIVTGPVTGVPATLAAGDYSIALGVAEYNDVVGADERFAAARLLCQTNLTVTEQTAEIEVDAVFGEDCQIQVTLTPPT